MFFNLNIELFEALMMKCLSELQSKPYNLTHCIHPIYGWVITVNCMQNVKIASNISNRAVTNQSHARIFTVYLTASHSEKLPKKVYKTNARSQLTSIVNKKWSNDRNWECATNQWKTQLPKTSLKVQEYRWSICSWYLRLLKKIGSGETSHSVCGHTPCLHSCKYHCLNSDFVMAYQKKSIISCASKWQCKAKQYSRY